LLQSAPVASLIISPCFFLVFFPLQQLEPKVTFIQDDLSHRVQASKSVEDGGKTELTRNVYCASNASWTTSVVSACPASNFHLVRASSAASTRTGFPPSTRVDFTLPLGRTTASI